jgi:hypothetical protein
MTNSTPIRIVLSGLVLALAACSGSGSFPTAPSTAAPVIARPSDPSGYTLSDVTLSGVVFEETLNGRAPIEAAAVYCEPCGAETHTWAYTDSNGLYRFNGVWTDPGHFPTRIWFRKDGYADPEGLPKPTPPNPSSSGWREVVVNGDTRFDVQLVRQ